MSKLQRGAICVLIAAAFSGGAVAAPCDEPSLAASAIVPGTPITLRAVMDEIAHAAPQVRRAALETKARQAEVKQAGRRLNPVVGVELENFAGSGPLSGFGEAETTFSFEQTFELGHKRRLRREAASANAALASAECGAILRQTQLEAAILFYELDAAVQVANFANESALLAQTLVVTVSKRVNAGAGAPPELSHARADAIALQAAAEGAKAHVQSLRYDLAAMWGNAAPQFSAPITKAPSPLASAFVDESKIDSHPLLDMASAQTVVSEANQDLAQSQSMPDVTLSAGFRRFEQGNDNALLFGVSVPFPIFDKNRDAVKAAGFRRQADMLNRVAVERDLISQQNAARAQLISAQKQLNLLETDALREARSAYDASVKGYRAGKFDLTSTLNTRRALIDAGLAVIDAARTVNIQDITLRSLTGASPFTGDIQ